MPYDLRPGSAANPPQDQGPSRVAIAGSGIAGLTAAMLLARDHDVTVYEIEDRLGGHTNTVEVDTSHGPLGIDTGFIVYNEPSYPHLTALFDHLKVETQPSDMSFAVSLHDGALEYSGSGLDGLFAQRRNLMRPAHWRLLADLVRFYRRAETLIDEPALTDMSLGDLMGYVGVSAHFAEAHILPMAAAIWSTPAHSILEFPARSFLRFFANHGLFRLANRIQWRTVTDGSRRYVEALTAATPARFVTGCGIRRAVRTPAGLDLHLTDGRAVQADHLVLACHADQALAMIETPSEAEAAALSAFRYEANRAVTHRDTAFLPRCRRAWSSWNYLSRGSDGGPKLALSYWMNRLQSLPCEENIIVTLNPAEDPEAMLAEAHYTHPIFDAAAVAAQKQLMALQGTDRLWFAGAHLGYGFHEDGVQSAMAVARGFGLSAPWERGAAPLPLARIAA